VIDAHFRESGNVDADRDALTNFARYELQMSADNLRKSKIWLPAKQRRDFNYARMVFVFRYSLMNGI